MDGEQRANERTSARSFFRSRLKHSDVYIVCFVSVVCSRFFDSTIRLIKHWEICMCIEYKEEKKKLARAWQTIWKSEVAPLLLLFLFLIECWWERSRAEVRFNRAITRLLECLCICARARELVSAWNQWDQTANNEKWANKRAIERSMWSMHTHTHTQHNNNNQRNEQELGFYLFSFLFYRIVVVAEPSNPNKTTTTTTQYR